ncbi:MAG: MoaD/ThiS family protein [Promethearchaeota archaeon]
MSIKVKLFGFLKEKVGVTTTDVGFPYITFIDAGNASKVKDILTKFSIDAPEVSHIFVNNRYVGINKNVKDGDVVGLFPRKNMSLLYKWYFYREEDE